MTLRYREVPIRSWTRVPNCPKTRKHRLQRQKRTQMRVDDGTNAVIVGEKTGLGGNAFTYKATNIDGAPTVVFIHGSLDDAAVWGGVIAALGHKVNTATYDLPGFGSRGSTVADPDLVSLASLAAETGE